MAIYLPITNPLRLWPLTELNPQTCEADYCRPQVFFTGDVIVFQLVVDATNAGGAAITGAVWVAPDGNGVDAGVKASDVKAYTGVMAGRTVFIVSVKVPKLPLCRLEFTFGENYGGVAFKSGWVSTTADRDKVVKINYDGYDSDTPPAVEEPAVVIDTLFPGRSDNAPGYKPFVYTPGGFFTSGYKPGVDCDSYLTERYVSRYTHAYPRTSRTLVLGDARGIDNALAETLNAAFCMRFSIDGRRYVRYDGAQLEALGNDALPLRAWSIALQAYDGGTAVLYDKEAWNSGSDGALIDASGRYIVDASGRYITI